MSNFAGRLRESLPPHEWQLLQRIAGVAAGLHLPLYIVGGLPRDLILGNPSSDFDLVVEGKAEALARSLQARYGGRIIVHSRFGTAKWDLRESASDIRDFGSGGHTGHAQTVDFVSARSETYKHPAALPTVRPGSIEDDLRRRDFSINALAIRLDGPHQGELRDAVGGRDDLENGVIRVLNRGSFLDDPTRMYRAVRYEQRYKFHIEAQTLALIRPARGLISGLSAQRIRHELDLVMDEPRTAAILKRLDELDLLKPIHTALIFDRKAGIRLSHSEERPAFAVPHGPRRELCWLLWLIVLHRDQIESVNARLHFSASLSNALLAASDLVGGLDGLGGAPPSRWVERLDAAPLVAVYAVYLASRPAQARRTLGKYLAEWRHVKPATTGQELKRLGLEPGAQYKSILWELRRAWLDGQIRSPEQEQKYLQVILRRV